MNHLTMGTNATRILEYKKKCCFSHRFGEGCNSFNPTEKKIQYLIKIFDFNTKAEKLTSAILLLQFFHP